ncbi:DUF21-domain-containing protein [Marasmius fiardii PR-910]|nr:DUF21-domain-containing protein [Marasmius fiardii PR-910]
MKATLHFLCCLLLANPIYAHSSKSQSNTSSSPHHHRYKAGLHSKLTHLLYSPSSHDTINHAISSQLWCKISMSVLLVLLGGVFSGLTLALMGMDSLHLRVLAESSASESERRNARKVLGLLQKGRHWVLVVLLLSNVVVNESLPIFLDGAIGGGVTAVVISTVAIVIFGYVLQPVHCIRLIINSSFIGYLREIIPQAVGLRYGLAFGAACVPAVSALMWIMYPAAYPIARLLDAVVGVDDVHTYRKPELKSLLEFHRTGEEPLRDEEITILTSVLEFGSKGISDIMTPMKDVVTLATDTVLDRRKLDQLLATGYSRFPVHAPGCPTAFVGLLLVKQLLHYDLSRPLPVSEYSLSILPEALPTINCFQALSYFRTGRSHLLLISKTPGQAGGAIGVVTLEGDCDFEIISEEIIDETDLYQDNVSKQIARRWTTSEMMKGIVENLELPSSLPGTPVYESDSTLVASPIDIAATDDKDDKVIHLTAKRIENWQPGQQREGTPIVPEIVPPSRSRRSSWESLL